MSANRFKTLLLSIPVFLLALESPNAQNVNDPMSFSNQVLLFGNHGIASDPVSGIMPGTAYGSGFGSFLDNPASIALLGQDFGEFSFVHNRIDERSNYLGNESSLSDNQTRIAGGGFVYNFPTYRGRFVIGAGYTQHTSFNRAVSFNSWNNNSTITDQFKIPGSTYNDVAFDTYAIDYGDEFEDWDESIFRVGFSQPGDFLGIRQQGEFFQTGHSGEYSAFFASEILKNMMFGASVGVLAGRYGYDRIFQEIDDPNNYNSDFIDSSGDGIGDTDIDNIIFSEEINNRFYGFRGRAGLLYQISSTLNLGVSYTLPSRINMDEDFSGRILSTFNNGVRFDDRESGRFTYSATYPARTAVGVAIDDLGGLSISASAEYVNYSNLRINFEDDELFEDQQLENEFISQNFADDAISYRAGIAYKINPIVTLRAGYGFVPSMFKNGNDDRNIFSAGAGFSISRDAVFEIGARYTTWKEDSALYTYADLDYSALPDSAPPFSINSEDITRNAGLIQVMATLRFRMN